MDVLVDARHAIEARVLAGKHSIDEIFDPTARAFDDGLRPPGFVLAEPLEDRRAPREPAAERDDEHLVAATKPPFGRGLAQRDRDRGCRRVAVLLDVHEDALHREA